MREQLEAIARHLDTELAGDEIYTASFHGERSDFVRFNRARVRQAGTVTQATLELDLIAGRRHATGALTLSGRPDEDRARLDALVARLRAVRALSPDDPHLLFATDASSHERIDPDRLPDATAVATEIIEGAAGLDGVGVYAAGSMHDGFASSFGARHWQTTHSYHVDFSVFAAADRAIKSSWGGFEWSSEELRDHLERARARLQVLRLPARRLEPGVVRAYLSPVAMQELMSLLCWDGFGVRAQRTKTSPFMRMLEARETLDPRVTIREATAEGIAPPFQEAGFVRPPRVTLIEGGRLVGALVSPRSAAEYDLETNGAAAFEAPLSLAMEPGEIPHADALEALDTGVAIGNLWYLNFSDRVAGRITGMTRFATFWVEAGRIVAPLQVMRFDDTVFRMLGSQLAGLTDRAEMMLSADTYDRRSSQSACLPGALLHELRLVA